MPHNSCFQLLKCEDIQFFSVLRHYYYYYYYKITGILNIFVCLVDDLII